MIEAQVFGDPEGMRALAKAIVNRADVIASTPLGAEAALDGASFEGRAAERLRGTTKSARSQLASVVGDLHEVASALFSDAAVVERQNAEAAAEAAKANADAKAEEAGGNAPDALPEDPPATEPPSLDGAPA
jgi:type IV secretory pathway TrbL component